MTRTPQDNQTFGDDFDEPAEPSGAPRHSEPGRPPALPHDDEASRYSLHEELGRGGLGRVQRGWDLRLDREVAIKTLLQPAPAAVARFERETRVTARLQHPNIVPIHDGGLTPDGLPFLAMRLVHGRSLAEAIEACPGLEQRLALLPHVIDACNAVAYAHAQRVAHRDLKPDNILVGDFGETVVIDWGLAKELDDDRTEEVDLPGAAAPPLTTWPGHSGARTSAARTSGRSLTRVGAVMGTPAYMSPEQAAGRRLDERADVYALGAVLYHTLAGVRPYHESPDTLAAVVVGPPRPLIDLAPGVPRDLAAVTAKAMAREPSDRYPDARALAAELERFQAGAFVSAHHYSALDRLRRAVRQNPATAGLLAILVVGTLGGVGLLWRANGIAERGRTVAEAAQREAQDLRELDRQRADAATLDQARSALDLDPGRTLALLDSLSPERPFDAEVRALAAAAVAEDPPVHLALPSGPAAAYGVEWTSEGLFACVAGQALWFGPDLTVTRSEPLPWEPSGCVVGPDGTAVVSGRSDLVTFDPRGGRWISAQGSPVASRAAGPGVRWALTTADGDLAFAGQAGELRVNLGAGARRAAVAVDGTVLGITPYAVYAYDSHTGGTVGMVPTRGFDLWTSPTRPEAIVLGAEGQATLIRWDGVMTADAYVVPGAWWEHAAWVAPDIVLLGGGEDQIVALNLETRDVRPVAALTSSAKAMALSPDGVLAVATDDGALSLLTWPSGELEVLSTGGELIFDLAWSPDGRHLAAARRSGVEIRSPSLRSGRPILSDPRGIQRLVTSPDGTLAALSWEGGSWLRPGQGPVAIEGVAGGDGDWCDGQWWLTTPHGLQGFDAQGQPTRTFELPLTGLRCLTGHEALATLGGDLVRFDLAQGTSRRLTGPYEDIAVSPSGEVAVTTSGGEVLAFAPGSTTPQDIQPPDAQPPVLAWWRGEPVLAASDAAIRFGRGAAARLIGDVTSYPTTAAVGGDRLLVGDADGTLWVWPSPDAPPRPRYVHRQYINVIAVDPTGRWAATGGWDDLVVLWDLSDPALPARVLRGHHHPVARLRWSIDGRTLYSGDRSGEVRSWTDPLPTDPAALRAQVHALAAALAEGRPLPPSP